MAFFWEKTICKTPQLATAAPRKTFFSHCRERVERLVQNPPVVLTFPTRARRRLGPARLFLCEVSDAAPSVGVAVSMREEAVVGREKTSYSSKKSRKRIHMKGTTQRKRRCMVSTFISKKPPFLISPKSLRCGRNIITALEETQKTCFLKRNP